MAKYNPPLSLLLGVNKIPSEFQFIKDFVQQSLSNLRYDDIEVDHSNNQSTYNIRIISLSQLDLPIASSNFELRINSSTAQAGVSEFDVIFSYSWPIASYIANFDYENFSFDLINIYDLLVSIGGLTDNAVLFSVLLGVYHNSEDEIEDFIADVNDSSLALTSPIVDPNLTSYSDTIDDIVSQLSSKGGFTVRDVVQTCYLSGHTIDPSGFLQLTRVLEHHFGTLNLQRIKELVIPQFSCLLESLSVELAFPRTILKPLDANGDVIDDETVKAAISFSLGDLSYSTTNGFSMGTAGTANLSKAQISSSGFTVAANGVVVDLNDDSNISQADADGRPESFKGIFIQTATIGFPKSWSKDSASTATITGSDLLMGSPGGISGTIGIDTAGLLKFDLLGLSVEFSTFQIEFKQNSVISSDVTGTLIIPGLKDGAGDEAELDFSIDWSIDGYNICVSEPQGLSLEIPNVVEFTLNSLCIGQQDGEWQFSVEGRIDRLLDIPMIGKAIPKFVDIDNFEFFEGEENKFDLTFGWEGSPTVNLTDEGLSATEFYKEETFDINKTFLGILEVHLINFAVDVAGDKIELIATLDASLKIGPLIGTAEGAGFKSIIEFPSSGGGNLGPADLSFELVPPSGIGLSMGTAGESKSGFSVSGFLSYDQAKKSYKGAVDVKFAKITASAYGILALELPGGEDGFSLLVIISVEFNPGIELGLGFALDGVGGVLGLHRTTDTQVLRLGVKEGTIDNLLFPPTPISEKAPQILSTVDNAFPIQKSQFVFGPMAQITWGTESILSVELGLIVEIDNPFRIMILGVVKSLLPAEDKEMIKLQVNFFGEINLSRRYITFDASLYDSSILSITLTGDMLLRVLWSYNAGFLITVGGFHPKFDRPANMMLPEKVARLTVSIVNKRNIKIRSQSYFAISSNTVQFGASASLYVKAWKFTVEGRIGFDVLIFYRPKFRFFANVHASLSVKWKRFDLFGVSIDFTLEGPGPFHAYGKGRIKILGFGKDVKFNETFGQRKTTSLPSVDVGHEFREILMDIHSWETVLPDRNQLSVAIRSLKELESEVVVHPLGSLRLSQKTVPLGIKIVRFGNANPRSDTLFNINSVSVEGNNLPTSVVKERFAPGQFFKFTKSDLLKESSFKYYQGGVSMGLDEDGEYLLSDVIREVQIISKEEIIIDGPDTTILTAAAAPSVQMVNASFGGSSAVNHYFNSPRSHAQTSFEGTQKVNVVEAGFVAVDENGNQPGGGSFESYEEGLEWFKALLNGDDSLEEDAYEIVPAGDYNSFSG